MKSKLIAGGVVSALIIFGVTAWVFENGLSVGEVNIGGSESRWLADKTYDFLEDVQFKDFDKASTYHLKETQAKRDIPGLIQRVFFVKHEALDILRFKVSEVDLDRSQTRARVRTVIWYRVLGDKKTTSNADSRRETELLFYWFKDKSGAEAKWTMELSSSLE